MNCDDRLVLPATEERFRALATATSDAIFRMNPDWTEMWHLEGREFIVDTKMPERHWMERYIHADDRAVVQAAIDEAIRGKCLFELEHRVVRADGTLGWTHSRAVPMLTRDGEITEWIGMASDVTGRTQLESSLREADRRKDEFLATLAHELRNPLAPIRNAVHFMKLHKLPDDSLNDAREIIDRQVQHMVRLVDDLLDVSRITLGQITLRNDRFPLRRALEDALDAIAPAALAEGHELDVKLPPPDIEIAGDATRISQIFQNLLDNAVKYTPQGGQIVLRAERVDGQVRISVRDSGFGIPSERQARIFDLFTRVHPDERIKTSGLGIGLSLARQLVELHGGRIEVASEGTDRGSEFVVYLPSAPPQEAAEPTPPPKETSDTGARRVLVVDDNRDAADSLAMILEMSGTEVAVAYDGAQALVLLDAEEPDVVLMDIGMPGMDGYEVARRIRSAPGGDRFHLVALTGWGQADDKERALQTGFNEHLTKPVDPTALAVLLATRGRKPETATRL
jgi:signal transduction histidine kinase/ActR/RegA family two-component response regulator